MLLSRNNTLDVLERLKSKVPIVRMGSILEEPKPTVQEKTKTSIWRDVPRRVSQLSRIGC